MRTLSKLRHDGAPWPEIAARLGRSLFAVKAQWAKMNPNKGTRRNRPPARTPDGPRPADCPVAERDRVTAHWPTFEQTYFGDPPPGRSALDRKLGRSAR